MKVLIFLIIGWMNFWHSCSPQKANSEQPTPAIQDTVVSRSDTAQVISFATEIRPILQTRCSPCHFQGGKMYAKMPFDKAETILSHTEGVLRRIKQEPDAQKIKDFFQQNSK